MQSFGSDMNRIHSNTKNYSGELYTNQDRDLHLQLSNMATYCSIGTNLGMIALPLVFIAKGQIEISFLISISVIGLLGLILTLLKMNWIFHIKEAVKKQAVSTDSVQVMLLYPTGKLIFSWSVIQIIISLSLSLFLFQERSLSRDLDKASAGEADLKSFDQTYLVLVLVIILLNIINVIIFSIFAFTTFICSISWSDLGFLVNLLNIGWIILTVLGIFALKNVEGFFQSDSVSNYSDKSIVFSIFWILCSMAFVSCVCFFVNSIVKRPASYMFIGSLLIICVCILSGVNFHVSRGGIGVRNGFTKNCFLEMRKIHQSWLQKQSCPKYMFKLQRGEKVFNQQCLPDQIGLMWELDKGQPPAQRLNRTACLNQNCCGLMSDSYVVWFRRLSFLIFVMTLAGLFNSAACFQLAQREPHSINNKTSDTVWFFVLIVIILALGMSFYYGFVYSKAPPPDNQVVNYENKQYETYQQFGQLKYQPDTNIQNIGCVLLKRIFKRQIEIQLDCTNKDKKCTNLTGVRVSLVTEFGAFRYHLDDYSITNVPNLRIYSSNFVDKIFKEADKKSAFIAFEGQVELVNNLINEKLYFCGGSPAYELNFFMESFQIELEQYSEGDKPAPPNSTPISPPKTVIAHQKENHIQYHFEDQNFELEQQKSSTNDPFEDKCTDQFKKLSAEYEKQCRGAFGDVLNLSGYFRVQLGPEGSIIDNHVQQTVKGSVFMIDECNADTFLPASNAQFIVQGKAFDGKFYEIQSVKTSSDGHFSLQIPTFKLPIEYQGKFKVVLDNFLEYEAIVSLGGGNYQIPYDTGIIKLLPQFGFKNCQQLLFEGNNNQVLNHNKGEFNFDQQKGSKPNKVEIQQFQNNTQTDSFAMKEMHSDDVIDQLCHNKEVEIQQDMSVCQPFTWPKRPAFLASKPDSLSLLFSDFQQNQQNGVQKSHETPIITEFYPELSQDQSKKLDEIQFYNLDILVYDSSSKQSISKAYIEMYSGTQPCQPFNEIPLIFKGTNQVGQVRFFNVVLQEYTIIVKKPGYYHYCDNVRFSNDQNIHISIPLAKQDQETQVTIVLEHNDMKLSPVSIGASVNFDEQRSCLLSYFNPSCGKSISLSFNEKPAEGLIGQTINIKTIEGGYFLFFLVPLYYTKQQILIIEKLKNQEIVVESEINQNFDNKPLFQKDIRLKVYVYTRDFEVAQYQMSADSEKQYTFDPSMVFLPFCFDGDIGIESQRSIAHFWDKVEQPTNYWERSQDPKASCYPNANICEKYFDLVPYAQQENDQ